MKTWLTYLAASAMGLAFQVVFKESALFSSIITIASEIFIKLGTFVVFPLAFFTMASGTASLTRKKGANSYVLLTTIFWSLFTTTVLSIIAALMFRIYPAAFPVTSTTPENAAAASEMVKDLTTSTLVKLKNANPISVNAFLNLIKSSDCIIPIAFLALIFGYAIRPTSEIMRPAYIFFNSISEVMFRLVRQIAKYLWIGIFFVSGVWFETLWCDGTVFASWQFVVMLCIITFGLLIVVIPLIYAIATGFKRNPYRQIVRLFSASTAAFFSVNYMFSQTALYSDCRINLGIQKRIVAATLPIHTILTKGGSALMGTICSCSIIYAYTGSLPGVVEVCTIALACTLISFVSSLHAGYEVLFATSFALGLLKKDLSGAEFAILGILPLLNGISLLFDTLLAGLGTSFTAVNMNADCYIKDEDTV